VVSNLVLYNDSMTLAGRDSLKEAVSHQIVSLICNLRHKIW